MFKIVAEDPDREISTLAMIFRTEGEPIGFILQIALWLWFTVLFANFAKAMAEGRGKAQANALRKTRTRTIAHRRVPGGSGFQDVPADEMKKGDIAVVSAGEAGYDGANSGGTNLGPLSAKLAESVKQRVDAYRFENGLPPDRPVPADAVTASGSGLDPHISVGNALLQAPRVARERRKGEEEIRKLVRSHAEGRDLGVFGEELRVNVLKLNLALDGKR